MLLFRISPFFPLFFLPRLSCVIALVSIYCNAWTTTFCYRYIWNKLQILFSFHGFSMLFVLQWFSLDQVNMECFYFVHLLWIKVMTYSKQRVVGLTLKESLGSFSKMSFAIDLNLLPSGYVVSLRPLQDCIILSFQSCLSAQQDSSTCAIQLLYSKKDVYMYIYLTAQRN